MEEREKDVGHLILDGIKQKGVWAGLGKAEIWGPAPRQRWLWPSSASSLQLQGQMVCGFFLIFIEFIGVTLANKTL